MLVHCSSSFELPSSLEQALMKATNIGRGYQEGTLDWWMVRGESKRKEGKTRWMEHLSFSSTSWKGRSNPPPRPLRRRGALCHLEVTQLRPTYLCTAMVGESPCKVEAALYGVHNKVYLEKVHYKVGRKDGRLGRVTRAPMS